MSKRSGIIHHQQVVGAVYWLVNSLTCVIVFINTEDHITPGFMYYLDEIFLDRHLVHCFFVQYILFAYFPYDPAFKGHKSSQSGHIWNHC